MSSKSINIDDNKKYYKDIIALMPGHVYWKNKEGAFLGCNLQQATDAGFTSPDEIVGKTDYDMPWSIQADYLRNIDLKVMESGLPVILEELFELPDGTKKIYLSNKLPLFDENKSVAGILGISFDITDRKKLEEDLIKAKAFAQAEEEIRKAVLLFTGTMSHDLRTPLSSINMVASYLNKELPVLLKSYKQIKESNEITSDMVDGDQFDVLADCGQRILEHTQAANSYIDITLKMVKGAAAGAELLQPEDLISCSISKILNRVVASFPFSSKEYKTIHLDQSDDFVFMGNAIFMTRILQNLIKNAFEQIQLKGKGEIFIQRQQAETFNYLKVKDTAGGVPASVVSQLFQEFSSTKQGGTGLGLSSAKQIMNIFGGDITCQLVDDDCIEFILSFPKITTNNIEKD